MERIIHLNITQDITHGTTIIFICAILTIVASFIDMWTGLDAARVNKEPISSRSLRKTIAKIVDYLRVVLFAVLIDVLGLFFPWYAIPYCVIVVTLEYYLLKDDRLWKIARRRRLMPGKLPIS